MKTTEITTTIIRSERRLNSKDGNPRFLIETANGNFKTDELFSDAVNLLSPNGGEDSVVGTSDPVALTVTSSNVVTAVRRTER